MRKSLLLTAVLSALTLPTLAFAEDAATPAVAPAAAEPASPHTFSYNVGLYSQYIFRGLTQTAERPAIQGGADYSHSSGLYAGTWASNINWLEDGGNWHSGSLEWDIYGGFRNTIGDTGIGYDVGLLNYVYPGSKTIAAQGTNFVDPYTLEAYAALSWKWLQAKYSYSITDTFGVKNSDGTYYVELNANYPIADSGYTVMAHVGRQEFDGKSNTVVTGAADNDKLYSYTDWKLGLSKTWANGVVVGGYYTDTNARDAGYTINKHNIGDSQLTAFVQKTF
jgi:uncharacterized protein (TIGR02001 family)